MAKTPKKAAAKRKTHAKASPDALAPEAKKPKARAAKAQRPADDERITAMHGETRIIHAPTVNAETAVEAICRLVDGVHALGRAKVTSVAIGTKTTSLHLVLPDHPGQTDLVPGIILTIDPTDGTVSFDHVAIGRASPELVDDAAYALLHAIGGDDENPANAIGRRADWFEQATIAAEDIADRRAAA